MITTFKIFPQIFREKQEKSKKRLEEFLKNSGEKQIHDLRTSIRRMEAAYLVFPNSFKNKKTNNFVYAYKSFFKKISILRDFDVIADNLLKNGLTENSELIKYIVEKREKKIKNLLKKAKKLSRLKITSIRNGNHSKIAPKYEKIIFSNVQKIQDFLPIISSDESKIKELHMMRKTAKKLRYLLEIEPEENYSHLVSNMKHFQEILGDIHDYDITIDFLRKNSKKFSESLDIIKKQEEIRSITYQNLASLLKK